MPRNPQLVFNPPFPPRYFQSDLKTPAAKDFPFEMNIYSIDTSPVVEQNKNQFTKISLD